MARGSEKGQQVFAVIWSMSALDDIDAIEAYVTQDSPLAARRIRAELVAVGDSLTRYPERGVRVRGAIRKLLVASPWVIRYAIQETLVTIISVRDGRRRRP